MPQPSIRPTGLSAVTNRGLSRDLPGTEPLAIGMSAVDVPGSQPWAAGMSAVGERRRCRHRRDALGLMFKGGSLSGGICRFDLQRRIAASSAPPARVLGFDYV